MDKTPPMVIESRAHSRGSAFCFEWIRNKLIVSWVIGLKAGESFFHWKRTLLVQWLYFVKINFLGAVVLVKLDGLVTQVGVP